MKNPDEGDTQIRLAQLTLSGLMTRVALVSAAMGIGACLPSISGVDDIFWVSPVIVVPMAFLHFICYPNREAWWRSVIVFAMLLIFSDLLKPAIPSQCG